jgi:hypothetical protein
MRARDKVRQRPDPGPQFPQRQMIGDPVEIGLATAMKTAIADYKDTTVMRCTVRPVENCSIFRMKVWIDQTKRCAAFATSRMPPEWFEISAKRWPPRLNWNAHTPPTLSKMDKIFLAVMILVLIARGYSPWRGRRPRSRRHFSRSACSGTEESGARCARLNGLRFLASLLCWRYL